MGARARAGCVVAALASLCALAPAAHGATLVKIDRAPGDGVIYDIDATRMLIANASGLGIMDRANRQVTHVPVASGTVTAALLTSHGAIYETYAYQTDVREINEFRDGVTSDLGPGTDLRVAGEFALWNNDAYHDDATRILYRRDLSGLGTTIPIATNVGHSNNDVAANGDVAYWTNDYTVHRWRAGTDVTIGTPSQANQQDSAPTTDGVNVLWRETPFSSGGSSLRGYGPPGGSGSDGPFTIDATTANLFPSPGHDYRGAAGWIAYTGMSASHQGIWLRDPDGDETNVGVGIEPEILALSDDGDLVYATSKTWFDRHVFIYHPGPGAQPIEVSGNPYGVGGGVRGHGDFTYRANDRWYAKNWGTLLRFGPEDLQQGARTSLDAAPSGDGNPTHASIEFSAVNPADPGATFECSLDNGDFAACASPLALTGLARGPHTLAVRSIDSSGHYDVDPATVAWGVDSTPPDVTIDSPPARTNDSTPSLAGTAGDAEEDGEKVTVEVHQGAYADDTLVRTLEVTRSGDAWTAEVEPALPDGLYTVQAKQSDVAGNQGVSAPRSFRVDTTPPNPSFGPTGTILTGHPVTFEANGSSDADSGSITRYEWDLDGDGDFERDTGSTSHTSTTYATRGTIHPGLRVTDSLGETASVHSAFEVYPAPPPGLLGITINGADRFTNSANVYVNPVWPIGVTEILLSNDGGFGNAVRAPVAVNVPWRLASSGPERLPKTVYARFSENGTTYQDDIILDETPPTLVEVEITKVDPRVSAAAARKRIYYLHLRARDRTAGVNRMQITTNRKHPGPKRTYRSRVKFKATTFKIFVRVRDRAGNWSHWKRATS